MKYNFVNLQYRTWGAVVIGGASLAYGAYKDIKGSSDTKKQQAESDRLFAARKPYKTPKEVMDVFNQTQYNAQTGYDPTTLDYLTSQTQNATNSTLDTSKFLGGDPNNFASILDQNFQQIFKIGSENNLVKMKKFDALLGATNLVIGNKDAEFASQDNLLKDQLQASALKTQVDRQNQQNGLNLAINGLSTIASSQLFKDPNNSTTDKPPVSYRSGQAYQNPLSASIPQYVPPTFNTNFNIKPQ